jgi:hypothetical protein
VLKPVDPFAFLGQFSPNLEFTYMYTGTVEIQFPSVSRKLFVNKDGRDRYCAAPNSSNKTILAAILRLGNQAPLSSLLRMLSERVY